MKSVALHNLGCKVNAYEMDAMQQMLQERGYKIVPFDQLADIYIINTCTVTNIADRKSRQMLHRAKKQNPDAVVVAVGCYVQTGEETVEKDEAIDLAIGNNRKKDLIPILEGYLEKREAQDVHHQVSDVIAIGETREYEEMSLKKTAEHTRAYIKIQDGCNQFCSYCIIPYARGRVRSREEEDIFAEVSRLVEAGYQEIVLTGIHLSSYGIDRGEPELLQLLEKLHAIEKLRRIRLGSLEPRIITEEFAGRISRMPKICPHFHLSLQSGCDSVLQRMNRRYDSGEYFEKTQLLRKYYENPAITTDVIVGFPGETWEEFKQTRKFVEKVQFFEMHIFKYSRRHGTRAAQMDGQLTEAQKAERSNILLELERTMSRSYRERFLGCEVEVLLEEKKEIAGRNCWIGHTPQYVRIALEAADDIDRHNTLIRGKAVDFLQEDILLIR